MKIQSLQELKAELQLLGKPELVALCLRLSRYKKENKELLAYLLFQSHQPQEYTQAVKELMQEQMESINSSSAFLAKKTLRKVLRTAGRYAKYSGDKQMETELLLHYCEMMEALPKSFLRLPSIKNIQLAQIKKLEKTISTLHEDLQYDYLKKFKALRY